MDCLEGDAQVAKATATMGRMVEVEEVDQVDQGCCCQLLPCCSCVGLVFVVLGTFPCLLLWLNSVFRKSEWKENTF